MINFYYSLCTFTGDTPLLRSSYLGRKECVELLLKAGATGVNETKPQGNTIIYYISL